MIAANEKLITLSDAASLYPPAKGGKRPHISVIWRHCRQGIRARNGERIHLEHSRFGGTIYTTAEAIRRFGAAVAEADRLAFEQRDESPATPTPAARRKQIQEAEKRCDRAGV